LSDIRVLIVERDQKMRALEAHFLRGAGYVVDFAEDGQSALALARATLPEVVITEILVAKLDGLALCRQLKADEKTRGIAVVVFTILASGVRATEAGADAFLMKPLAELRLLGTLQRLLHKQPHAKTPEQSLL
jgi:DNA-binding response OmpR family regulator